MHYYKFNIGDYSSHTQHLSESEDLAYRRMLDYCYLNEIGLPKAVEDIARLIRMRTHCDCIANVLREYFTETKDGFINQRCEIELFDYKSKSEKAKDSAKQRWRKSNENDDANAMRTQCDGNAKHKPLTNKQETLNSIITSSSKELSVEIESIGKLPTNKKGESFKIYQTDIDLWKDTYQSVNVLAELKKIHSWLDANPTKRKTSTGMKRFINSWLSKTQDSAKSNNTGYISFEELALGEKYERNKQF
jgi:uncharacterized protein YdaU (DUF1376 family)